MSRSDNTDPRLGVLRDFEDDVARATFDDAPGPLIGGVLADLDAADRAAGIVRVDTRDDLVDALDMIVGILQADMAARFRPRDPRVVAMLDRVDRLIAALREES